jgi:hypothetical protein
MSSLSAKDRVSLCQFSFADGRRCRTPRTGKHPHFCFDHAQKEARALAEESLSKDLAYFFSGDHLSACDLSTALGRLIPAVIRGEVKPRNARTVAYMAQILLQSIHVAEHEYTNTFGSDGWRKSIRNSVNGNYNYRFPRAPQPEPVPAPVQPPTQPQQPASQPTEAPVNCRSSLAAHHSPLPQSQQTAPPLTPAPASPPKATPPSPSAPPTPTGATSPAPPEPQAQPPASQPNNPRSRAHPLRHASQAGTPLGGSSTIRAASAQTVNFFRINTYKPC